MNTKWSSVLIAVVLAGCASKAPQSSRAAPHPSATTATTSATPIPPPPAPSATTVVTATPKVESKHASKLAVKRITIARGVERHEPVDPGTSFDSKAQKVYAFVEVDNPEKLPGEISVEFQPPSKKYEGRVTLGVGETSRWRTWAFTRQAHEVGEWTAVVRDERGRELGREKFDII